MTRGALIAAMYVALSILSAIFGLSSGAVQFRLSEMLCILPIFLPEAVPGLFIGCILSNIISGCVIWDIIIGSLATLVGAIGARMLSALPKKHLWISTLPNFIANTTIVPLVLMYAYGVTDGYVALMISVGIGEAVCGVVGGSILGYSMNKIDLTL